MKQIRAFALKSASLVAAIVGSVSCVQKSDISASDGFSIRLVPKSKEASELLLKSESLNASEIPTDPNGKGLSQFGRGLGDSFLVAYFPKNEIVTSRISDFAGETDSSKMTAALSLNERGTYQLPIESIRESNVCYVTIANQMIPKDADPRLLIKKKDGSLAVYEIEGLKESLQKSSEPGTSMAEVNGCRVNFDAIRFVQNDFDRYSAVACEVWLEMMQPNLAVTIDKFTAETDVLAKRGPVGLINMVPGGVNAYEARPVTTRLGALSPIPTYAPCDFLKATVSVSVYERGASATGRLMSSGRKGRVDTSLASISLKEIEKRYGSTEFKVDVSIDDALPAGTQLLVQGLGSSEYLMSKGTEKISLYKWSLDQHRNESIQVSVVQKIVTSKMTLGNKIRAVTDDLPVSSRGIDPAGPSFVLYVPNIRQPNEGALKS